MSLARRRPARHPRGRRDLGRPRRRACVQFRVPLGRAGGARRVGCPLICSRWSGAREKAHRPLRGCIARWGCRVIAESPTPPSPNLGRRRPARLHASSTPAIKSLGRHLFFLSALPVVTPTPMPTAIGPTKAWAIQSRKSLHARLPGAVFTSKGQPPKRMICLSGSSSETPIFKLYSGH